MAQRVVLHSRSQSPTLSTVLMYERLKIIRLYDDSFMHAIGEGTLRRWGLPMIARGIGWMEVSQYSRKVVLCS